MTNTRAAGAYHYEFGNAHFDPGPPTRRVLLTPSDTVDLVETAPLLRFVGSGTVCVLLWDEDDAFSAPTETVSDGGQYVGAVRRLKATGTTASPTLKVYACYPSA